MYIPGWIIKITDQKKEHEYNYIELEICENACHDLMYIDNHLDSFI